MLNEPHESCTHMTFWPKQLKGIWSELLSVITNAGIFQSPEKNKFALPAVQSLLLCQSWMHYVIPIGICKLAFLLGMFRQSMHQDKCQQKKV